MQWFSVEEKLPPIYRYVAVQWRGWVSIARWMGNHFDRGSFSEKFPWVKETLRIQNEEAPEKWAYLFEAEENNLKEKDEETRI